MVSFSHEVYQCYHKVYISTAQKHKRRL